MEVSGAGRAPFRGRAARAAGGCLRPNRICRPRRISSCAWDCPASQIDVAGRPVWLEGFTDDEPHTVIVIGDSGRRLTLRVVAPETAQDAALAELVAASHARPATDAGVDAAADTRSLDEVVARLLSKEEHTDERRTQDIERWVHQAATQFVGAPIQAFVPILVEHIVRQQMTVTPRRSPARI